MQRCGAAFLFPSVATTSSGRVDTSMYQHQINDHSVVKAKATLAGQLLIS